MVKPKVRRTIVMWDQILMRACMTIDMSSGETVDGWGEGCCLPFKLRHADQPPVTLLNGDFVFARLNLYKVGGIDTLHIGLL